MPNTFILCTILENELKSSNHPAYADIPRESNGSEQFNQKICKLNHLKNS